MSQCASGELCAGSAPSLSQGLLFFLPLVLALLVFAAGAIWYRRTSKRDGESRDLTRRTIMFFIVPGSILLLAGAVIFVGFIARN